MNYVIEKAYPNLQGHKEITIKSSDLYYSEIVEHHGVQCCNNKNAITILNKCEQIADLIREIEILNKK